ncbi:hypothetical membrane protein, conserved [Pyrococcus sp. NA2]|uniref:hypothetical protein n=1 Tax=Pyrococcus sp. (strain NA2) TaxID=342949 RepID=UPI000209ADEC|nr:hypothetical protein [Pyrococcus sp. NA2]AEC51651.1 hypothetical membrane protein, conserved [Pyrococcus sp. NA2]
MAIEHVAIALASILLAILITRIIGEEFAWINRKIIHFSIIPAILMLHKGYISPGIFSAFAFLFAILQLILHLRKAELKWFQISGNYGEVFFAFSSAILPLVLESEKAVPILLTMAISDGITGIIRFEYFRKKGVNAKLRKHWSGSIGFFASTLTIFALFGFSLRFSLVSATILTLAEYQRFVDDNIAVPLVGAIVIASI